MHQCEFIFFSLVAWEILTWRDESSALTIDRWANAPKSTFGMLREFLRSLRYGYGTKETYCHSCKIALVIENYKVNCWNFNVFSQKILILLVSSWKSVSSSQYIIAACSICFQICWQIWELRQIQAFCFNTNDMPSFFHVTPNLRGHNFSYH
jgi:hypothetical protein